MIAVNLNQLSKKYGRRIGISGIDLTVNEGEIFGLIGPDGAGKTTILRILMNYITPSDGDAEIFDMDVTDEAKEIKRDTAYVPGEIYFYNKMKAGKYISLTLKAHHCKKNDRWKELMQVFDIDPKERFEDMDRSDQKKMALIAAIACSPRLLLLDEPLRGLDANVQNRLFDYLLELQEQGSTIIITGRDVDEVASICNRITIIENGEITVTPDEFAMENPDFESTVCNFPDETEETDDTVNVIDTMKDTAEINLEDTIVIIPPTVQEELPAENTETAAPPVEAEAEAENPAAETEAAETVDENSEEATAETANPEEAETQKTEEVEPEKTEEDKPVKKEKNKSKNPFAKKQKEKQKDVFEKDHTKEETKTYKNITMKSTGFSRDAFEEIGAEIVSEENGKIIMEYSGNLSDLAKLLYDLKMDDICINSKDLQEEFLPFYEGGGKA